MWKGEGREKGGEAEERGLEIIETTRRN